MFKDYKQKQKFIDKAITWTSIFLVVYAVFFGIPTINNIYSFLLEWEIANVELPEDTKIIDRLSIAGKMNGNGSGMQYLGLILIESELSLSELQKHYNAKFIEKHPDEKYIGYHVEVQKSRKLEIVERGMPRYFSYFKDTGVIEDGYYIVYIFDPNSYGLGDWDIRAQGLFV